MATKKNGGRPKKNDADKVKVKHIYISDNQEKKIKGKHKSLTKAVLEMCA